MTQVLKVFAEGEMLVPDYEALDQGQLRFIGRKRVADVGVNGGWAPTGEVVKVPFRLEYLQELKAGALLPADEETARLAGVEFHSQ